MGERPAVAFELERVTVVRAGRLVLDEITARIPAAGGRTARMPHSGGKICAPYSLDEQEQGERGGDRGHDNGQDWCRTAS